MRFVLYFIASLILADIVAATFIWPPADQDPSKLNPAANAATWKGQDASKGQGASKGQDAWKGQDPWMANEKYNAPGRDHIRELAQETLDRPWSLHCTPEGHKSLIGTINNYYYQRQAQVWSYENTYGEDAKAYAIKAWMSPDDNRIERLIGETYGRGYFSLDELQPYARTALASLVKNARVTAKPCVG